MAQKTIAFADNNHISLQSGLYDGRNAAERLEAPLAVRDDVLSNASAGKLRFSAPLVFIEHITK